MDIKPFFEMRRNNNERIENKKKQIQEDFNWGVGPKAFNQITLAEYKTNTIAIKEVFRLFLEHYLL